MIAEVCMWGRTIGAVSLDRKEEVASFQYAADFISSGIELSPLKMPLGEKVYRFPELGRQSFKGLPGLLADVLPDRFGNALIDQWLAIQGRKAEDFSVVDRLCYIGNRGMGALEFKPAEGPQIRQAERLEIDALVKLASEILQQREAFAGKLDRSERDDSLRDLLRVGTSAGGARAKAVIAWNPQSNEIRSGQVEVDKGFEHWLLKFDGVSGNRDKELNDPEGFGAIEYAYSQMAKAAGIEMTECRLLEENGRRHFMTRRFDRLPNGERLHMQTLGALAHFDFNQVGAYSYEQAFQVARQLNLPMRSIEELFRRMLFNIVARNQDDHVKNIAFLMNKQGSWALTPAYDMTYSYNPSGDWTAQHQMTLNGKRDNFMKEDIQAAEKVAMLKRGRGIAILAEVIKAVQQWPNFANEAKVNEEWIIKIGQTHRLSLLA